MHRRLKLSIVSLILIKIVYATHAYALDIKSFKNLHLQLGSWLENYQQVQSKSNGEKNGIELNPYISSGLELEIKPRFSLMPEVGYVFQRTQNSISKNIFFLRSDLTYSPQESLRFRLGSSLMIQTLSGSGGEDTLKNGSSTEVYYIPDQRRTTYNQTLDFAVEYLKDNFSFKIQSYIYAWAKKEKRMTTYSLSIDYIIPIEDLL